MRLPSNSLLEFNVIGFSSPDDALLRRCLQSLPLIEFMKVLLHDDVATTLKWRVLRLDENRLRQTSAGGIFGAIDKAKKVTGVKVSKTLDLIGDRHGVPQGIENEPLNFKTHVGAICSYVEQQIPWRCHSNMHRSPDFSKGP